MNSTKSTDKSISPTSSQNLDIEDINTSEINIYSENDTKKEENSDKIHDAIMSIFI